MSSTQARSETAIETPRARTVDMKLEVVVIPVSDVDRAKRFYGDLGWSLDADFATSDQFRVVQFTPPGSPCSIIFGQGMTSAVPGSAQGLYLIVSDIEAARAALADRGVDVSQLFHDVGGVFASCRPGRAAWSGAVMSTPCSAIRTATAGCSRKVTARSPGRVDADDTTLTSSRDSRARSDVRRPRTGDTRADRPP